MNRRHFLGSLAATSCAIGTSTLAQAERDWSGKNPTPYPDPDIIVMDARFAKYKIGNTPIQRHFVGCLWAEGPAWNAMGKFVVWSDIPNNRQMRFIEDDSRTTVFRNPAGNSNGNTFDFQGRQLACEHGNRRVVRYEHDGSLTVLADKWDGKPLNAPNDIVVHPDGGVWFTDPGYGSMMNYEGNKGKLMIKEAVYRIDGETKKMQKITDELEKPNGICFSPDYKKVYIADTGDGPTKGIHVYDVTDNTKAKNRRLFTNMDLNGKIGAADGIRPDVDGNIWVGAGWVGGGYDGVHVFSPDGTRIGLILLPEICANLCFGGPKRNRLYMAASQSLYSVYVETQGAHIC